MYKPAFSLYSVQDKKEDPGPVIFAYDCVGKNGKIFKCYKFRSMVINAQERLVQYLRENEEAREEWEKYYKLKRILGLLNLVKN